VSQPKRAVADTPCHSKDFGRDLRKKTKLVSFMCTRDFKNVVEFGFLSLPQSIVHLVAKSNAQVAGYRFKVREYEVLSLHTP